MKIIATLIPTNVVTNRFLSLFCPFVGTKRKNQLLRKLVVWQRKIFLIFFIASCTLLQRYIEFNKLLQKNVLTYYACLFIGGTLLDISKSFDKTCCDGLPYEYVLKYDGFYFNKFSVAKNHHSILSSGNCQFDPTPNSSCDYHYCVSNTDET